ncbi:hypothetical protein Tco_1255310 [Tanacetum coccineum]
MVDNRTMAELLQAPTEGYEDAIVSPEINANFKLKHGLINLVQNKQFFGHDKEDPHAHIRYFNKMCCGDESRNNRIEVGGERTCCRAPHQKISSTSCEYSSQVAVDYNQTLLNDSRLVFNEMEGDNHYIFKGYTDCHPSLRVSSWFGNGIVLGYGIFSSERSAYLMHIKRIIGRLSFRFDTKLNRSPSIDKKVVFEVQITQPSSVLHWSRENENSKQLYRVFSELPVVERETEVTKDTMPPTNKGSTKDVQPSVVQVQSQIPNSEPAVAPVSASMPN